MSHTVFDKEFVKKIFDGDASLTFPGSKIPQPEQILEYYEPDCVIGANKIKVDIPCTPLEEPVQYVDIDNKVGSTTHIYDLHSQIKDIEHFGFTFDIECCNDNVDINNIYIMVKMQDTPGVLYRITDIQSYAFLYEREFYTEQLSKFKTFKHYIHFNMNSLDDSDTTVNLVVVGSEAPSILSLLFHNNQIYKISNMSGVLNNMNYAYDYY